MRTTKTATITNYLIERRRGKVNLCESQGDAWITIRRDIDHQTAERFGFNLASPSVRSVFGERAVSGYRP